MITGIILLVVIALIIFWPVIFEKAFGKKLKTPTRPEGDEDRDYGAPW